MEKRNLMANKVLKRIVEKKIAETPKKPEWYSIRHVISYSWAMFYILLGAREAGKSYAVTDLYCRQFKKYGRPFYWLRLTDSSANELLMNNAAKLVDPDLRRKYNLDLRTCGSEVYDVKTKKVKQKDGSFKTIILEKKFFARVLDLSTFYNDKGSGLFDKDFLNDPNMYYNMCLDEMNREEGEKNTFDVLYSFTNQVENLIRSTKARVRLIMIGNSTIEASDILTAFRFIPEEFGFYKLGRNKKQILNYIHDFKKEGRKAEQHYQMRSFGKRCVIDYIEPSEQYLKRREGTAADILTPTASTFTNKIETDSSLVYKGRLQRPTGIIKFTKDSAKWFTVWDGKVITKYRGEKIKSTIAMRPYQDELFDEKLRNKIIEVFDKRSYFYGNLITFKLFQREISLLKPRK
jgi:hypothetical protein